VKHSLQLTSMLAPVSIVNCVLKVAYAGVHCGGIGSVMQRAASTRVLLRLLLRDRCTLALM
jgi:hypothetical protein